MPNGAERPVGEADSKRRVQAEWRKEREMNRSLQFHWIVMMMKPMNPRRFDSKRLRRVV